MGTNQLVYIRTDGNSQIATGHLVRCLSIANACLSRGIKVCFLLSDNESEALLKSFLNDSYDSESLSIHILQTACYHLLEQELSEVTALLTAGQTKDCVYLLDSYFVTKEYLAALRPLIKLAYLDDLQLFDYNTDLIINYDVITEKTLPDYQAAYQNAKKTLLGALYTPLRSQFQNKTVTIKETVSNLLITTGGSDPYHFCLRLTDSLMHTPALQERLLTPSTSKDRLFLHIVIGKLNPDKEKLYQIAEKLPCLQLHENVTDMAALMSDCDLAVSAAGTTLYELCALGIPAISFTMADNQIISANAFAQAGAIPYAGDIRTAPDILPQKIIHFVTEMSETQTTNTAPHVTSFQKRTTAHEAMRSLVDGNGADRIALALSELE